MSWNDGATWQSMGFGLPDTQVSDLVVEKNDLVIATHGRSMYVLDDIAPIRTWHVTVAAEPLRLIAPHVVTRGVDEATIQYVLSTPDDSVRVDILDATGKLVRSFKGEPKAKKDSTASKTAAPIDTIISPQGCETRRRTEPHPTGEVGLNRFTWDLRYPGAASFDCMILWGGSTAGPIAVPGRYTVRVSANGVTQSQPLVVRMDPRLKGVTLADLREQFALAMRIRDRVTAADSAVIRTRKLRSEIAKRLASGPTGPDIVQAGEAATTKLLDVETALYQTKNRSGQDPLNFPIKLNNRLAALGRSVETGDARPTAATYVVFRQLSADLDHELARLQRVIATEVAAFERAAGTGVTLTP